MATPATFDRLWTVHDVAAFVGCSTSAVYKWTERSSPARPKLPCVRVGALLRFRPDDVRAWVDAPPPNNVVPLKAVE